MIYSGWADPPPTIDGQIFPPDEWAAAGTGTHTWYVIHHTFGNCPQETQIIMYVMNDADNL